jgi:hypothetical protein
MAVKAHQSSGNAVPVEEDPGPPGVLAEDDVRLAELSERSKRHVLEVPDRCRADDQH